MIETKKQQAKTEKLHQDQLQNMRHIGFLVHNSIFITKKDIAYAWDDNAKELYVKEE